MATKKRLHSLIDELPDTRTLRGQPAARAAIASGLYGMERAAWILAPQQRRRHQLLGAEQAVRLRIEPIEGELDRRTRRRPASSVFFARATHGGCHVRHRLTRECAAPPGLQAALPPNRWRAACRDTPSASAMWFHDLPCARATTTASRRRASSARTTSAATATALRSSVLWTSTSAGSRPSASCSNRCAAPSISSSVCRIFIAYPRKR